MRWLGTTRHSDSETLTPTLQLYESIRTVTQGRRPTPNVITLLRGNPGKRPVNEQAPEVPAAIPKPPRHLSKRAKAEWRWVTPLLARYKIITELDRPLLELYCEAYARFRDAEEKLSAQSMVLVSKDGQPFHNPYLSISKQARIAMHKCLVEMGMTPAARSNLITSGRQPNTPPAGNDRSDPLGLLR